jgi:hypothetical protein
LFMSVCYTSWLVVADAEGLSLRIGSSALNYFIKFICFISMKLPADRR